MEIILWILGVVFSGLFSWFFTHLYYKKALKQQASETSNHLSKLIDIAERANITNRQLVIQKRIEESIVEYKRAGTPIRVIDTYNDMSNDEKADLLDTVLLRVKGRKAKTNKYRAS